MSTTKPRWGLDEIEISKSASEAALNVVRRLSGEKAELNAQWAAAIRLAQANGASLRDMAEVAERLATNGVEDLQGLAEEDHQVSCSFHRVLPGGFAAAAGPGCPTT